MKLPHLNLPEMKLDLRAEGDLLKVRDLLRHKYVALTPEEYVRQHFVNWMVTSLHYPPSMMANEVSIKLNDTARRCDTVVFDREGQPLLIVEYKRPTVAITQEVFDQVCRYNMVLKARYLAVSNGLQHYFCRIDLLRSDYHYLPKLPDYRDIYNPLTDN